MSEKLITSLQNPRVKDAVRLRAARHRAKQDRILIDGTREISQAIAAGVRVVEAFICPSCCNTPDSRRVWESLEASAGATWRVTEEVFEKLAFGVRLEGVLAIAETPRHALTDFRPRDAGPIAVIEAVEKPGNVGAVLRSADAAGVSGVIVAEPATDLFNPNCIRSSLGAVFQVPVCTATAADASHWLSEQGIPAYAALVDARLDYTAADLSGRVAIVLGSEAAGLSQVWRGEDVTAIRLPMLGAVDSLNISAAAAVLFYEALRQRR